MLVGSIGEKNEKYSREPTNALLKTVLLNGGQALLGVDNIEMDGATYPSSPYDGTQGFGRASLEHSLYL